MRATSKTIITRKTPCKDFSNRGRRLEKHQEDNEDALIPAAELRITTNQSSATPQRGPVPSVKMTEKDGKKGSEEHRGSWKSSKEKENRFGIPELKGNIYFYESDGQVERY